MAAQVIATLCWRPTDERRGSDMVRFSIVSLETWNEQGWLPQLPLLPKLELPEQFVFLLRGQGWTAGSLLSLVDEAREDRPQLLQVRRARHLDIALQPLFGRWEAAPAGELGGDVHLAPFRMVPGLEQRLKAGEERFHEVH